MPNHQRAVDAHAAKSGEGADFAVLQRIGVRADRPLRRLLRAHGSSQRGAAQEIDGKYSKQADGNNSLYVSHKFTFPIPQIVFAYYFTPILLNMQELFHAAMLPTVFRQGGALSVFVEITAF
ncbi:MAG: hypothetical protein LUC36_04665 [Oscillospiraceae bacterium]|nr:hypothetical protein [Oscillospiraceae bacterium]